MKRTIGNPILPSLYEIECAVARIFNPRINIVVPNIAWGLGVHECDVLVVRPSGYAIEIEIKRSKQDLLADKKKWHGHQSKKIAQLYYAVPEFIWNTCTPEDIPENAGLILIKNLQHGFYASIKKEAQKDSSKKLMPKDILKAAHLGTMRIWVLKQTIIKLRQDKKDLLNK